MLALFSAIAKSSFKPHFLEYFMNKAAGCVYKTVTHIKGPIIIQKNTLKICPFIPV